MKSKSKFWIRFSARLGNGWLKLWGSPKLNMSKSSSDIWESIVSPNIPLGGGDGEADDTGGRSSSAYRPYKGEHGTWGRGGGNGGGSDRAALSDEEENWKGAWSGDRVS